MPATGRHRALVWVWNEHWHTLVAGQGGARLPSAVSRQRLRPAASSALCAVASPGGGREGRQERSARLLPTAGWMPRACKPPGCTASPAAQQERTARRIAGLLTRRNAHALHALDGGAHAQPHMQRAGAVGIEQRCSLLQVKSGVDCKEAVEGWRGGSRLGVMGRGLGLWNRSVRN